MLAVLTPRAWALVALLVAPFLAMGKDACAQEAPSQSDPTATEAAPGDAPQPVEPQRNKRPLAKDPPGMKRLMPNYDVWIDPAHKRVVVDSTVVLREGQLEMLACPRGTKEHESILAADTKAYAVHAGLLAVGADAGGPVQNQPNYIPAKGSEVDVELVWTDKNGNVHRDKGQDWVRNVKTGKALEHPWVFGGSGFWEDEVTKEKVYLAESGDFICVSNFPTAMLDLPVESSQSNDALLYEAYTERIPPVGTRVRMVLTPKAKAEKADKP